MPLESSLPDLSHIFSIQNIIIYLVVINLIAFLAMFIDKRRAKKGKWRIKEWTLFLFVLLGGGIGGIAGMYVFHHKTKKPAFVFGFPAVVILEILFVLVFFVF